MTARRKNRQSHIPPPPWDTPMPSRCRCTIDHKCSKHRVAELPHRRAAYTPLTETEEKRMHASCDRLVERLEAEIMRLRNQVLAERRLAADAPTPPPDPLSPIPWWCGCGDVANLADELRDLSRWQGQGRESDYIRQAAATLERLAVEAERARRLACEAMGNARIMAHSYTRDTRPPPKVVRQSLAYPVFPRESTPKPSANEAESPPDPKREPPDDYGRGTLKAD